MEPANYGLLSLLPPVIAVILAIRSKNVILSLFCGGLAGCLILHGFRPVSSLQSLIGDYYFVQLTDSYNAGVIVLVIFIGGFIKLMEYSGGAQAFAKSVSKYISTPARAQIGAWLGGILIFFSDLGTPLLVGPVFKPIFDKLKTSREKLAWILDSTASPMAILVPFIGWGVYIMGLIQSEFEALGVAESDYGTFVAAIPFQFYAILCLVAIPFLALTKLDFGAMRRAEQRVQACPVEEEIADTKQDVEEGFTVANAKPVMVLLPIVIVFVTLFSLLAPQGFPFAKVDGNAFRVALTMGYFLGSVALIAMMVLFRVKDFNKTFSLYVQGMKGMTEVAVTLVLAWSLSSMISQLGTADFLIGLLRTLNFSGGLIPAVLFLFGACVSFSTGSSWGTFSILMPLAIPMAHAFGVAYPLAVGAVLSGGLFGDHCSPISDTTILSSTGAGCDLSDHVTTQLPYAVLNAGASILAYLVAGFTGSVLSLALAVALLLGALFVLNKVQAGREARAART